MARRKVQAPMELFERVDLFAELTAPELRKVTALAMPLEFVEDEAVTEEDTPGGRFHVIESGSAEVVAGGRTRTHLGPGDYFGELSLIDGCPRSASVIAREAMKTWSIAEWNFRPLLESDGSIAYKLLVKVVGRFRAVQNAPSPD